MNVMVVGCSPTGCLLVPRLLAAGYELSVVAQDQAEMERLRATPGLDFDGLITLGRAIDADVLKGAGIESMTAVAAATDSDNVNLMVCEIAQKIFGIQRTVALVSDPERQQVFSEHFGINTVCSTARTAEALLSAITAEDHAGSLNLGGNMFTFFQVTPGKEFLDRPIKTYRCPKGYHLLGVQRRGGRFEPAAVAPTKGPWAKGDFAILYRVNE